MVNLRQSTWPTWSQLFCLCLFFLSSLVSAVRFPGPGHAGYGKTERVVWGGRGKEEVGGWEGKREKMWTTYPPHKSNIFLEQYLMFLLVIHPVLFSLALLRWDLTKSPGWSGAQFIKRFVAVSRLSPQLSGLLHTFSSVRLTLKVARLLSNLRSYLLG